jgi:ABC-type antimicrobial peptide transport system permease subunit
MTSEGYRRIDINARPNVVNVYLKDGVDPEKYEKKLSENYGGSAKDKVNAGAEDGTLEEKISAKAEEKIATLLTQYGVTSVDYAVRIGDKLITGNSRNFVIKEIRSWRGMIKSQMEPIADATRAGTLGAAVLVIFIVFMILVIISASSVKRQRKNLGIMKSLGYSSKDLRRQMALKVMPVMIVSMVIASVVAIYVNKVFWSVMFATIATTDIVLIIGVDIAMIVLAYIMTYIGAGKIKKISVTELMTE